MSHFELYSAYWAEHFLSSEHVSDHKYEPSKKVV